MAIGTGRNLPFYPKGLRLTGVDLSPNKLAVARHRSSSRGRPEHAELIEGDAETLPFGGGRFDTVVCVLSLCTIRRIRNTAAGRATHFWDTDGYLVQRTIRFLAWAKTHGTFTCSTHQTPAGNAKCHRHRSTG